MKGCMARRLTFGAGLIVLVALVVSLVPQAQRRYGRRVDEPALTVEDYTPRSTLVVDEHPIARAKFPVVDVHSHHRPGFSQDRWLEIVSEMDELNLQVLVNLSGGWGDRLQRGLNTIADSPYPGFGDRAAAQLEQDVAAGAVGLKFFKDFGISVRDEQGQRVPVDHSELAPVFEVCAKLNIPVLIHTGEPMAFYEPVDRFNERWLELTLLPNRRMPPDRYPSFNEMMAERDRLFASHPDTRFIAAHMGWHANDLGRLAELLDRLPNVYVETAAILYELGRQPRTARQFFITYQDRVLFGKDRYEASEFPYYWRTFETADEYFDYYRRYHSFWQLYGMDLPDQVLTKLYHLNALKVVPGIQRSQFPPA